MGLLVMQSSHNSSNSSLSVLGNIFKARRAQPAAAIDSWLLY